MVAAVAWGAVADLVNLAGLVLLAVFVWRSWRYRADTSVTVAQVEQLGPLLAGYDALLARLRAEVDACEARAEAQAAELAELRAEVARLRRRGS